MLDTAIKSTARQTQGPDHGAGSDDMRNGLVAGTLVATSTGWVPAESLSVGDKVMTFDDGLQEITGVARRVHPTPGETGKVRPLLSVPAGLIGNRRPILLPEGQAMIVESDFADRVLGDPFATMDACDMLGLPGVLRILSEDAVAVVAITFERDQMIFVEGEALAYCPASAGAASTSVAEAIWFREDRRYHVLSREDARGIVVGMSNGSKIEEFNNPTAFGAPPA